MHWPPMTASPSGIAKRPRITRCLEPASARCRSRQLKGPPVDRSYADPERVLRRPVIAFLHYGSDLRIHLDLIATKRAMETIGSRATRGGRVTPTDVTGRDWSFVVSAGIPIRINENQ